MRAVLVSFFTAAVVSTVTGYSFFSSFDVPQTEVLAESTAEPTPTPEETATPTPSPTPKQTSTPTPTAKPIATATPTPKPEVTKYSPQEVEEFFIEYSNQYNLDISLLKDVASCESQFNAFAVNGPYLGMFQFSKTKWGSARTQLGLDANPALRADAREAIRTAAHVISREGTGPWPNCYNL